jgi:hypothetical protein
MGSNLAVKVRYALGSRKWRAKGPKPKARVSIVRWNLKEAGGKVPSPGLAAISPKKKVRNPKDRRECGALRCRKPRTGTVERG